METFRSSELRLSSERNTSIVCTKTIIEPLSYFPLYVVLRNFKSNPFFITEYGYWRIKK